jgi:hypothetical protein
MVLPPEAALRDALMLAPDVPMLTCDARDSASVLPVLVRLVEHALARAVAQPA